MTHHPMCLSCLQPVIKGCGNEDLRILDPVTECVCDWSNLILGPLILWNQYYRQKRLLIGVGLNEEQMTPASTGSQILAA
jgi:hypothetical protein